METSEHDTETCAETQCMDCEDVFHDEWLRKVDKSMVESRKLPNMTDEHLADWIERKRSEVEYLRDAYHNAVKNYNELLAERERRE